MRYIDDFNVLEESRAEPSFPLSQLPDKLKEKGLDLSCDPEGYLEGYLGYKLEPNEDPDVDWRLDVIAGSTCCVPLLNGYLNADNDYMDELHADGAVAGFFCYPLDTLREEEGSEKIFDFRDRLEETLAAGDGPEILTLTGGATGLFCGYVDFIAWDIRAVPAEGRGILRGHGHPLGPISTPSAGRAGTVALKKSARGRPPGGPGDRLPPVGGGYPDLGVPSAGTQPATLGRCTAISWSFMEKGCQRRALHRPAGPGRTCRSPCGTPTPATNMGRVHHVLSGRPVDARFRTKTPRAAACGTTGTSAPSCTAAGWGRPLQYAEQGRPGGAGTIPGGWLQLGQAARPLWGQGRGPGGRGAGPSAGAGGTMSS